MLTPSRADAPEFPRAVLGMLRQPLYDGKIIVARGGRIVRFPAAPHRQVGHVSAGRVAAAHDRARHRLADTPWRLNGDIPAAELRRSYLPQAEAMATGRRAVDLGRISAPTAHRVLRVAWTLADLEGLDYPGQDDCNQVLALHVGDIRWAPGQVMPRPHEPDAMSRQLNPAQQARIRPGRAQWRRGWPSSVRDRARLS